MVYRLLKILEKPNILDKIYVDVKDTKQELPAFKSLYYKIQEKYVK